LGCNGRQCQHARAYSSDHLRRSAAALMGAANTEKLRYILVSVCPQGYACAYTQKGLMLIKMINNKNNLLPRFAQYTSDAFACRQLKVSNFRGAKKTNYVRVVVILTRKRSGSCLWIID
jgi:hypothetical protein